MYLIRMIAVLAALALPGMASAETIEIPTATGMVRVPANPSRVAVFDMAALDTLDLLGVKADGIPDRVFLPELKAATAGGEVVGTLFEPNLEALSALAPDLIILGGRSSPKAKFTARIAPTIDMTIDGQELVRDAEARLQAYGRLFGREQAAEDAAQKFKSAIAAARDAAKGKGRALIVMTNGPKISAFGIGSRFGWIHTTLEIEPAVNTMAPSIHGEAVSFEFVRKADPDWLIVVDRAMAIGAGDSQAQATLDNELVHDTKAWKSRHVIYLPSADLYIAGGGIQAMTRVLAALTRGFSERR
ncbi:Petrobactin-binding protein YclQ [Rhodopseudomonas palustris]|uniref:ABC transporter, periplasmic Fe+3 siderophore binding protein n=1 Tax=Rhodopseudomonas palustris (strain ATCC BAA-98 / CGA009) TaxID=258594 RepID=Q6N775_RHOPA|nr:ABC transporter substrate-binding protein [Rhodopseudomonas palustris]OPF90356.1 iron ABC transporter substrate-binding protein [Rhodopseudomonas palustris]QQM03903.1 Petrobactin-binding protein YclQ [Rhodopseudomonas palustris]RJF61961.1 siderophore ABC transporter substrate-binding protein [Rhodopseudomonas palustris]WAB80038.1 siderophore ABC transporter substrate-binding protein [Rhodopseudomonas palustris]WCL92544.1 siderophore ABC transporter substrate-binding protein [Rhodopseudomona